LSANAQTELALALLGTFQPRRISNARVVGQFSPSQSVLECGGAPPLFTCMRIEVAALRIFRQFFPKASNIFVSFVTSC
jgi:hypothetical protein